MERIDLAIAILGVVAIGGSVVGLVTYDGGVSNFAVNFEEHDLEAMARSQTMTGTGSMEFTFDVTQSNLTEVRVGATVSTGDPLLFDRIVDVEVEGPNGSSGTGSGTISANPPQGGEAEVEIDPFAISTMPEDRTERGPSLAAVQQQVTEMDAHEMGTGTWSVTIRISADQSAPRDASYDLEGRLEGTYWDAHVAPETPSPQSR